MPTILFNSTLLQEEIIPEISITTTIDPTILEPPSHLFSDFIEMVYLGIVVVIGLVINVYVLRRLIQEKEQSRRNNKAMSSFLLLKLNLNISDILILGIHASGKLGWLLTYEWLGGEFLCRIFNFSSMFTLYLSSNIIVCIALDRLMTVLNAKNLNVARKKQNLVRLLLITAWMLAVIFSIPQIFVWKTYNAFKDFSADGWWTQCTDIWSIDRYEMYLNGNNNVNLTKTSFVLSDFAQNLHDLTHLFLVFFGPLIILIICYFIISTRLMQYASTNPCSTPLPDMTTCLINRDDLINLSYEKRRFSLKLFSSDNKLSSLGGVRRKSHHANVPKIDIREATTIIKEENEQEDVIRRIESLTILKPNEFLISKCKMNWPIDKVPQIDSSDVSTSSSKYSSIEKEEVILEDRMIETSGREDLYIQMPNRINDMNSEQEQKTRIFKPSKHAAVILRHANLIRNSVKNSLKRKKSNKYYRRSSSLTTTTQTHTTTLTSTTSFSSENPSIIEIQIGNVRSYSNGGRSIHIDGVENTSKRRLSSVCEILSDIKSQIVDNQQKYKVNFEDEPIGTQLNKEQIHPAPITISNLENRIQKYCLSSWNYNRNNNSSHRSSLYTVETSQTSTQKPMFLKSSSIPVWRRHLRSKAFQTTLLVIVTHVMLWSPYNFYALSKYVSPSLYERMNEKANVLKDLQFLITVINPFLYGFSTKSTAQKIGSRRMTARG